MTAGMVGAYPRYASGQRPKPFTTTSTGRLDNFIGGYYTKFNLSTCLEHDRTDSSEYIKLEVWSPGLDVPATIQDAKKAFNDGKGRMATKGEKWGPTCEGTSPFALDTEHSSEDPADIQSNHWFRVTLTIPKGWAKQERILFNWESGGEAMIFTEDEVGLQGFTGQRDIDPMAGGMPIDTRQEWIIPREDIERGSLVRYVEMSCAEMVGVNGIDPPDEERFYELAQADLVVPNLDARALQQDFETLQGLATNLGEQSPLGNLARKTANEIMNTFKRNDPDSISECRKVAEKVLGEDWEARLVEERGKSGEDAEGNLWGLGHCHIDTAWLWPWAVTKKKIARSWSAQIDLMDRYPEHRFVATSAQQYTWLEEYYPKIFQKLQEKVKEGKFEVIGGTWLEHDANMLSGESFCRQFILGQNFFQSRFGKRCKVFVLPDTFGYSAALPQIARLSGCEYFFTQKISWNAYNKFPYTTFNWVGLDGTQIITHMTPVVNYNSQCRFDDIKKAYNNHQNLDVVPESMLLFGLGDGGGGPTWQMLERLRRARAVSKENDPKGSELPAVKMGATMEGFYEHIRKKTDNGEKLPTWWGELYLEIHRGTYTSQASTKRGNRKGEVLLREVEMLATLASIQPNTKYKYPHEILTRCWEAICLCQFHDTLPGSSIEIAVKDANGKYKELQEVGNRLLGEALNALSGTSGAGAKIAIINTLPGVPRSEIVEVEASLQAARALGENVQISRDGTRAFALVKSGEKVVSGLTPVQDEHIVKVTKNAEGYTIETWGLLVVLVNGRIVKIYDNQLKRDLIPQGQSAGFVIYEDHPQNWDAWDVDQYHLETPEHLAFTNVEMLESGPLRVVLGCEFKFGDSKGIVYMTLDAGPASPAPGARPLLRFDVDMDWQEKHRFLKFELPTTITSTEATYDAAFGHVKRPTHRNTSWDAAKFEVCAHKFADLSEYGYGIAMINDSKCGYAVEGHIMRLSLLRAPLRPDPHCDRGRQVFAFGILPHLGTFVDSPVHDVAQAFNSPLRVDEVVHKSKKAVQFPFKIEGAKNVFLETVKRGETDSQNEEQTSVILRTYEFLGGSAQAELKITRLKVKRVSIVNVLEDEMEVVEADVSGQEATVALQYRPFEIKTIKIEL